MEIALHKLNRKQLKIVDKMDGFIYTYRNNMKKDPERIVLFREDYNTLFQGEKIKYKGFEVVST